MVMKTIWFAHDHGLRTVDFVFNDITEFVFSLLAVQYLHLLEEGM
jgi:hypothetical protein